MFPPCSSAFSSLKSSGDDIIITGLLRFEGGYKDEEELKTAMREKLFIQSDEYSIEDKRQWAINAATGTTGKLYLVINGFLCKA